jgi:hypothetical protein
MSKADVALALASTATVAANVAEGDDLGDADWLGDSAVGRFLLDICLSIQSRARIRPLS